MKVFFSVLTQAKYLIFGLFFSHILVLEKLRDNFIEFDFIYLFCMLLPVGLNLMSAIFRPQKLNLAFDIPSALVIAILLLIFIQSLTFDYIQYQYIWGAYAIGIFYFVFLTFKAKEQYFYIAFLTGSSLCAIYSISGISLTDWTDLLQGEANQAENSNYLVSILPFAISCALSFRKSSTLGIFGLLTICVIIYALTFLISRTGMIAGLVGILIVVAVQYRSFWLRNRFFRQKWRLASISLVALCSVVLLVYKLYAINTSSVSGRYLIYKAAIPMLYESPLCGLGIQRFKDVYNSYQRMYLVESGTSTSEKLLADDTFFAFDEFLQVGIEMGLVGFGFFCILVGFVAFRLIDHCQRDDLPAVNIGAIASLITILSCCLSSYPLRTMSVLLNAIFFLAILAFHSSSSPVLTVKVQSAWPRSAGLMLIILSFLYCSKMQWERYIARSNWRKAAQLALAGTFSEAQNYYRLAEPSLANDGNFLFNFGAELHLAGMHATGLKVLNGASARISHSNLNIYLGKTYAAMGNVQMAEHHFVLASQMVPSRYLPKYLLFSLYRQSVQYSKACEMAREIVYFPIKIPSGDIDMYKDSAAFFLNSKN